MKKIGFLSFGHWTPSPQSQTRSAADTLLQSIDLAVAAEQLGADGAYFRVHHFARQLASPFPLLAAVGARTSRIEIGTAVIDMRYENPFYMAEDASAADLCFQHFALVTSDVATAWGRALKSGAKAISTIAQITFYGTDQAGREVSASGNIGVTFADWGDPDSGSSNNDSNN